MEIMGEARTYNVSGGGAWFSFVGDLLTIRLGQYGAAIESIRLIACLPSRTRQFRPSLEKIFDQFHEFLKKLPKVSRRSKRVEILFRSEHFTAEDRDGWKPTVEKCNAAAGEAAAALPLLKKSIKSSDEFDVDRFLADASRLLATKIDSMEEWESIRRQAKESRAALRETKSPWEKLGIDWTEFHPQARKILDDPFFWESANDLAPNGNDTGADLLADYKRWEKRPRTRSPMQFFDQLLKRWGFKPLDWSSTDEATVLKLKKQDPIALGLCNEAAIALAFAVLKMRAKCPPDIIRIALAGLARTTILVRQSSLSDDIKALWAEAIAKMKGKLESLPQ
jgi:uncharacterized protein YfeS